jgi:type I restriction enzyme, S subunit
MTKENNTASLRGETTKQSIEAIAGKQQTDCFVPRNDQTNSNASLRDFSSKQSVSLIPKLRFEEFTNEFCKYYFNDLTNITRLAGYEYSQYWQEDENEEIIALRGYNIGKAKLELKKVSYISNKLSQKLLRSRLNKGDIVYPCVGSIGNAVVIEEDNKYHIQQNIAKITCNEVVFPYFIVHFLTSNYGLKEVYRFNASGAQPNVLVGSLRKFKINLPNLPEQQKIASFLTAVDTKIQQLTTKKQYLENYKKGAMQQLFSQQLRFKPDVTKTNVIANDSEAISNSKNEQSSLNAQTSFPDWEEKKLGEIFKINAGGDVKKENVSLEKNGKFKYPIYANSEKNKGFYGYSDLYKVDFECITVTGRGALGVANARKEKFYPIVRLLVLKPKTKCDIVFFENLINQLNIFCESTGVPQLTGPQISTYKVNFPIYKEQQKIANYLSAIDTKIEKVQTQIEKTQAFKKGLLQQMFV